MRRFPIPILGWFVALTLAHVASAQVVISQIYGSGSETGAVYQNDYVELFNRGSASQSLTGWSIQYASATGTGNFSANGITSLSGTLAPGQYYLVKLGKNASNTIGTALPAVDATGSVNISGASGKLILANTTTGLACNGGSTACNSTQLAQIVDLVGYGTANFFEGSGAAPGLSASSALYRAGNGCTDSGNNNSDFATGTPSPRNTSTPASPCGTVNIIVSPTTLSNATTNNPYSVSFSADGGTAPYSYSVSSGSLPPWATLNGATLSGTPTDTTGSPFSFTIKATDSTLAFGTRGYTLTVVSSSCTPNATISQIQGTTGTSPLVGQSVTTSGIVTAKKSNGFFLQMPDNVSSTAGASRGVFVFTNSAPSSTATLGNAVCVTGTVSEYIPSADPYSPSLTEITGPNYTLISSGNTLPAPTPITAADTNPAGGLDILEKYEGMRVTVGTLNVIAPTQGSVNEANATGSSNGVFYGVVNGIARPFREAGIQLGDPLPTGSPCCVPRFDLNPERIRVDSNGQTGASILDVTTGATITNITGVLDYAYRTYTILPDPSPAPVVNGNLTYTAAPVPATNEGTIAAFNLERFYDTTDDPSVSDVVLTPTAFANRLNKASLAIRNVLNMPDILAVEEMENLTTLQALANKINTDAGAANPGYVAYLVEGNDIGGIDVGFLVKSSRVQVVSVTQYGKDTTYLNPNNNQQEVLNDRPPLVLRGLIGGTAVTVIANHLRSLNNVDDATVDGTGTVGARVRAKRRAQAEYLANLIQTFQAANANERIFSVGDYNAFQVNDGYVDMIGTIKGVPTPSTQVVLASSDLVNPDLTDMVDLLPSAQQYSYSFDGNAQVLDHILMNAPAVTSFTRGAYGRVDADFPETYRSDPNRPERISDHDPAVAYLRIAPNVTAQVSVAVSGLTYNRLSRTYNGTITVTNTSGSTIVGPIQVVLNNLGPAGTTLVNATGTLNGSPYVTAPAGDLAAGQSKSVTVSFSTTAIPSYAVKVYSGSF